MMGLKAIGLFALFFTATFAGAANWGDGNQEGLLLTKASYNFHGGGVETVIPRMFYLHNVISKSEVSGERLDSGVRWTVNEVNLIPRSNSFPWQDGRLEWPAWADVYEEGPKPVRRMIDLMVFDSFTPVASAKLSIRTARETLAKIAIDPQTTKFDINHERISPRKKASRPMHFTPFNRLKFSARDREAARQLIRSGLSKVKRGERNALKVVLTLKGEDGTEFELDYDVDVARVVFSLSKPPSVCNRILQVVSDED